jgi:hypothetical protein
MTFTAGKCFTHIQSSSHSCRADACPLHCNPRYSYSSCGSCETNRSSVQTSTSDAINHLPVCPSYWSGTWSNCWGAIHLSVCHSNATTTATAVQLHWITFIKQLVPCANTKANRNGDECVPLSVSRTKGPELVPPAFARSLMEFPGFSSRSNSHKAMAPLGAEHNPPFLCLTPQIMQIMQNNFISALFCYW